MTGIGSILWILAIGLFFYFMLRKGGCGGGHGHGEDSRPDEMGGEHNVRDTDTKQHRGGCCG